MREPFDKNGQDTKIVSKCLSQFVGHRGEVLDRHPSSLRLGGAFAIEYCFGVIFGVQG